MPNCWSYGTRTQCCAARSPGPLHAGRPGVAGRLVTAIAAPPLGRGLRGQARHDPGLASQAGLAQMGLRRTPPPARTSADPSGGEGSRDSDGNRESNLGTPPRAGRTGPARPIASPPPPYGRSCTTPVSIPHRVGRVRPGDSSSPRKPRPSWPWTLCTWTPCFSLGSMR